MHGLDHVAARHTFDDVSYEALLLLAHLAAFNSMAAMQSDTFERNSYKASSPWPFSTMRASSRPPSSMASCSTWANFAKLSGMSPRPKAVALQNPDDLLRCNRFEVLMP